MYSLKPFYNAWDEMYDDLSVAKRFQTIGGKSYFQVWQGKTRSKLHYKKKNGKECPLYQTDFLKTYNIFKKTGSTKTDDYQITWHAPYILSLLMRYFVLDKN